ncbi:hypothetical protein [Burkholderia phage BCSR5]|nr:hypothetical protein [Burkholderia phage BCSR5]
MRTKAGSTTQPVLNPAGKDLDLKDLEKDFMWGVPQNTPSFHAAKPNNVTNKSVFIMLYCTGTGRYLFCRRSEEVDAPHTWSFFGGGVDAGENLKQAAVRELLEEGQLSFNPHMSVDLFALKKDGHTFYTILGFVPNEETPVLNWENDAFKWVKYGRWPAPLHPGVTRMFANPKVLQKIRQFASTNVETRAAITAALKVTAKEGEWFYSMPPEMQKQYVEEHPDSKYAKDYKAKQDQKKLPAPKKEKPDAEDVKFKERQEPPGRPKPKQSIVQKSLKSIAKLPKQLQQFVKTGGTKASSAARKVTGNAVVKGSAKVTKGMLKDTAGVLKGANSVAHSLTGGGTRDDWKAAAKLGMTILASGALASAFAASGPAGFMALMALKHIGAPAMGNIVKSAWKSITEPSDEPVKYESSPGWQQAGHEGVSQYGYWKDRNTWVNETKEEWEAAYEEREESADEFKPVGAATVADGKAVSPEQFIEAIVKQLGEVAANGYIDDETWAKAIEQAGQQGNKEAE